MAPPQFVPRPRPDDDSIETKVDQYNRIKDAILKGDPDQCENPKMIELMLGGNVSGVSNPDVTKDPICIPFGDGDFGKVSPLDKDPPTALLKDSSSLIVDYKSEQLQVLLPSQRFKITNGGHCPERTTVIRSRYKNKVIESFRTPSLTSSFVYYDQWGNPIASVSLFVEDLQKKQEKWTENVIVLPVDDEPNCYQAISNICGQLSILVENYNVKNTVRIDVYIVDEKNPDGRKMNKVNVVHPNGIHQIIADALNDQILQLNITEDNMTFGKSSSSSNNSESRPLKMKFQIVPNGKEKYGNITVKSVACETRCIDVEPPKPPKRSSFYFGASLNGPMITSQETAMPDDDDGYEQPDGSRYESGTYVEDGEGIRASGFECEVVEECMRVPIREKQCFTKKSKVVEEEECWRAPIRKKEEKECKKKPITQSLQDLKIPGALKKGRLSYGPTFDEKTKRCHDFFDHSKASPMVTVEFGVSEKQKVPFNVNDKYHFYLFTNHINTIRKLKNQEVEPLKKMTIYREDTCVTCLEKWDDVTVIRGCLVICGHTLCLPCFERLKDAANRDVDVTCPYCRERPSGFMPVAEYEKLVKTGTTPATVLPDRQMVL